MLVVVIAVFGVTVTVVHVVDVVTVRHRVVPAVGPVHVVMGAGNDVDVIEGALVVVVAMAVVRMPVVEVVDVAIVFDGDVAAVGPVHVCVRVMGGAGSWHRFTPQVGSR